MGWGPETIVLRSLQHGDVLVVASQSLLAPLASVPEGFEALPVFFAGSVLREVLEHNRPLLERVYLRFSRSRAFVLERSAEMLEELCCALGRVFPGDSDPPPFARIVLARRVHPTAAWSEPIARIERTPTLAQASSAELGFLSFETVSEAGEAVSHLRCEILTADGELRTVVTDADGKVTLQRIVRGNFHLRFPELDESTWKVEGAAPEEVGRRHALMHVVQQGESLASIARHHGIAAWQRVWEHADNAALRKARPDPNVLYPDDEVVIPAGPLHQVSLPTDQHHRVVVTQGEVELRVRLQDSAKRPLGDLEYELAYEDGYALFKRAGAAPTDATGLLRERLPLGVKRLHVIFKRPKLVLELHVGQLDPSYDPVTDKPIASGVDARLSALGFAGSSLPARIAAFQRARLGRVEPSGEADRETCRKLEQEFGV